MTARAIQKSANLLVVAATSLFSPVACSSTSDHCSTNADCPTVRPCDADGGCQDTGPEGSVSASGAEGSVPGARKRAAAPAAASVSVASRPIVPWAVT
jgi:hypothetical protein